MGRVHFIGGSPTDFPPLRGSKPAREPGVMAVVAGLYGTMAVVLLLICGSGI